PMASRFNPVLINSVAIGFVIFSVVCVTGWFFAVEESRQLREINRTLVARNSTRPSSGVVNESVMNADRDSARQSSQAEAGILILPPGLGQEFPELVLPMTPDRAANFERRQIIGLPAPRRVVTEENF